MKLDFLNFEWLDLVVLDARCLRQLNGVDLDATAPLGFAGRGASGPMHLVGRGARRPFRRIDACSPSKCALDLRHAVFAEFGDEVDVPCGLVYAVGVVADCGSGDLAFLPFAITVPDSGCSTNRKF